jgi:hypothetical protein
MTTHGEDTYECIAWGCKPCKADIPSVAAALRLAYAAGTRSTYRTLGYHSTADAAAELGIKPNTVAVYCQRYGVGTKHGRDGPKPKPRAE